jgi:hypothetical protein
MFWSQMRNNHFQTKKKHMHFYGFGYHKIDLAMIAKVFILHRVIRKHVMLKCDQDILLTPYIIRAKDSLMGTLIFYIGSISTLANTILHLQY